MSPRAFKFMWCFIPANLCAAAFNLLVTVAIPFGAWRLSEQQFLSVLLGGDAVTWAASFAWFWRHPIMEK